MKRNILGAIVTTAVIGTMTLIGGCATMRHEASVKAPTDKLEQAQADMRQTVGQVDKTSASLNTLVKPDQLALQNAFDEYKNNVDQMEKLAKQVDKNDADIRSEGRDYFSKLQQKETSYTDPKLRQASSDRRAELNEVYGKVPQTNSRMKEALTAYVSELKQIQAYLSSDLTPKGIEAMKPAADKAVREGENVKELASPVLSAMARAITAMTPEGAGAAAGGTKR